MEKLTEKVFGFKIYGDNLEECTKLCEVLIGSSNNIEGLKFLGKEGPIDRPVHLFEFSFGAENCKRKLKFGLFPCGRYQDWKDGKRPVIGVEDPDVIICHSSDTSDVGTPILGIEFNDAIPAGNNAWQRFPRVAQAAEHNIPFIYVIPAVDAEIKDGVFRSFRHPNVIFQIAQFNLMEKYGTFSVTLYSDNPWYVEALEEKKACPNLSVDEYEETLSMLVISEMLERISSVEGGINCSEIQKKIKKEGFERSLSNMLKCISKFISTDFTLLEDHPALEEDMSEVIKRWWQVVEDNASLSAKYSFLNWTKEDILEKGISFSKRLSTSSLYKKDINPKLKTPTAFSYKDGGNEVAFILDPSSFTTLLLRSYSLEKKIQEFLLQLESPVLFLPIAGYVQDTSGPSFSRPDKGLVRLIEETFATNEIFKSKIVLLYSGLIPNNWKEQVKRAKGEDDHKSSGTNNLWRELIRWSDLIITDSQREGILL